MVTAVKEVSSAAEVFVSLSVSAETSGIFSDVLSPLKLDEAVSSEAASVTAVFSVNNGFFSVSAVSLPRLHPERTRQAAAAAAIIFLRFFINSKFKIR